MAVYFFILFINNKKSIGKCFSFKLDYVKHFDYLFLQIFYIIFFYFYQQLGNSENKLIIYFISLLLIIFNYLVSNDKKYQLLFKIQTIYLYLFLQFITMQLKEIYSFLPAKFAYHLSQDPLLFATHPSSNFLAFATRANQVCFFNRKTGRASIILNSKHGISLLLFTQDYLIVIQKSTPQILVYSLKTQKLKKKVTGHRSQVLCAAYCPQRGIFCTASHDVCMIWQQSTLNSIKVLKCSTSTYCDCHFTFNGQYLFTAFSDGNIFGWNLEAYTPKQDALSIEPHRISSTCNQYVVAYTPKKISIASFSQQSLIFQVIQPFWEGYIEHVDFIDSYILIKTSHGLYLAEVIQQHQLHLRNHKQLIDQVLDFQVAKYSSEIIIISKDLTKIRTMKIFSDELSQKIPLTNQLINPNSQCIGGYSNENGCIVGNQYRKSTYNYSNQNYKIQQMNDGLYRKSSEIKFSQDKIKAFIRKNFIFPDKYRPIAYKNLLHLPISQQDFLNLQRKGRHSCVKILNSKYPLDNLNLSQAMKDVISLLAHYDPIFAESDLIPTLVFPFVCIFGQDRFFCFEVLYRLFNNWLSLLFQNFPLANSQLLQNIQQLFEKQDQAILNHLRDKNISFTKLIWSLLSTLFSTNLNREGLLAVVDTLFSYPQDPSFIIFMVIAYVQYNRTRIFSLNGEKDLDIFLDEQHTVNISLFIKQAYKYRQKLHKYLHYPFRPVNNKQNHYIQFNCYPKHAVKMYQGKRRLEQEQYNKVMNQQRYHDQIAKQMQKMVTKIKRQSDKAAIQSQAVILQSENESKNYINLSKPNNTQRKKRLKLLMSKLQQMLINRNDKKVRVKQFIPLINQINQRQNDEQLDQIQQNLMGLMAKIQPNQFNLPLTTQPMTFGKQKADDFKSLKAAKRAQMANKLWQSDKMHHGVQENLWQNNFQNAMKY